MLGGIVAVYFPTVCYWASKSCTSCETWYKDGDVAEAWGNSAFWFGLGGYRMGSSNSRFNQSVGFAAVVGLVGRCHCLPLKSSIHEIIVKTG